MVHICLLCFKKKVQKDIPEGWEDLPGWKICEECKVKVPEIYKVMQSKNGG